MSYADWTMVAMDSPSAHNTIGLVGIYDAASRAGGPLTYDEVLKYVEARLHVAESFRERMVRVPFGLDRPCWVRDDSFDLEYHVREIALPAPGTWRQFCAQIARIHARSLDLTRPPWELYLISGLDGIGHIPPGAVSMFMRVHHCAVDGVAGVQMSTALHTHDPADEPPPPAEGYEWKPERAPSDLKLVRDAALHGVTRPLQVVRSARAVIPQLPQLVNDARNPDVTTPAALPIATRFNQLVSPHRVFGTSYTTLDVLKQIRTGLPEAKINDIGLAVVAGAMRAYLLDKDELPAESLRAMMPISVRPKSTHMRGGAGGQSSTVTGNEYSVAPIAMATDEPDPMKRLQRIVTSTAHVKSADAHPIRALMAMSEETFGGLMGTAQRAAVRALARAGRAGLVHTLVSNVPGPLTPMYFCGAPMVDITGLGPVMDGMSLNNGISSYGGRFTFCFTSDRDAMPDPEFYEQCLARAIEELLEATAKP